MVWSLSKFCEIVLALDMKEDNVSFWRIFLIGRINPRLFFWRQQQLWLPWDYAEKLTFNVSAEALNMLKGAFLHLHLIHMSLNGREEKTLF